MSFIHSFNICYRINFPSCTKTFRFFKNPFSFAQKKMASLTASVPTSSIVVRAALLHKPYLGPQSSPLLALPAMSKRGGKVSCSMEGNSSEEESNSKMGMSASLMAAALAATTSSPAMALVDERLSTEGTGLPFGLSNNLLGWILLGVFGLIWGLYFVYTSTLEEDEESGLSL